MLTALFIKIGRAQNQHQFRSVAYALSMWFLGINREEKGMLYAVLSRLGIAGRK